MLDDLIVVSESFEEHICLLDQVFETLKDSLTEAPVMATADFSKKFKIQCDASNTGIGAVLTQGEGYEERPIAFDGRKFRGAEINYDTTQKECLAAVCAVEKFRPYVERIRGIYRS